MAINAVCPDCRAEYTLADQQQGKKVRCKHCDSIFVVGGASGKKAAPVVEEVTERPAPKPRPAAVTAKRAKPARITRDDDDDDDDDFDAPRPKKGKAKKGGSALPWILGVGGVVLVLAAVGVIVLMMSSKGDSPSSEVASAGEKPIPSGPPGPPMIGGQRPPQQGGNVVNAPVIAPPITGQPTGQPIGGQPVAGQPVAPTNPPKTEVKQPDPPADEEKEEKNAVKGRLSRLRSDRSTD